MTDPLPDLTTKAQVEAARAKQRRYEDQRQSRLGAGAERLTSPIGGLLARFITPAMLRRILAEADRLSAATLPRSLRAHDFNDLAACEAAALQVQALAQGGNATTGGLAGWFGAAGLAADVPATIGLAARTVRATAVVYGFDGDTGGERAFRLMVLEVATSRATERRRDSLGRLNALARELNTPEARIILEQGGEWVTEKLLDRLARQLGISLGGRKLGQVVPVMGSIVGAVVNASFQADVARAARYAYRQRWLMSRKVLPNSDQNITQGSLGKT